MGHQTPKWHREFLLCLLTHKIGDPLSLLYFSVVNFVFPLQVVSIYMIFLETIKGKREKTLKRHTKSEKTMLSDYFTFCNNLFFSDISKKKYADILDFPKGAKSVSFFFFSFHFWWRGQIERKVPSPSTAP